MQRHGPSDYTGPLRGTTAWWRGSQDASGHLCEPPQQPSSPDEAPGPDVREPDAREEVDQTADLRRDTNIRHELVERVRRDIAAGVYDTPELWQAALDRLLDRLDRD
jgi:hypothetical protein